MYCTNETNPSYSYNTLINLLIFVYIRVTFLVSKQRGDFMKKTISFILSIILILGLFSGCKLISKDSRTGKEIAKLMLANERLDSGVFTKKDNSGLGFLPLGNNSSSYSIKPLAQFKGGDFDKECNMLDFFKSYMESIRSSAESAAALIDSVKENVSFTDVWIPNIGAGANSRVMLCVESNTEILIDDSEESLRICRRYTDDNANNVYEIYTQEKSGTVDTYFLYIPEKRYEFSLVDHQNKNSNFYLVSDNSRGYWNMFTTYFIDDPTEVRTNTQNLISAGDTTYVNYGEIYRSGYKYLDYTIFTDSGCNTDIMSFMSSELAIRIAAFDGIETVVTDQDNFITSFTTSSGKTVNVGDTFDDGTVSFAFGNAVKEPHITRGDICFRFPESYTNEAKIDKVISILSELGVTCKYDISSIKKNVSAATSLGRNFGQYYSWNGYLMSDLTNVEKAAAADAEKHKGLLAEYEERKDNKTIEITSKGVSFDGYEFATISALTADAVSFENGSVVIKGLNATVNNLSVFDEGEQYSVHLALAKLNDDAAAKNTPLINQYSHNKITLLGTIPLGGTVDADYTSAILMTGKDAVNTTYTSGDTFSLSQTASFALPDCSEEGVYTVAAYIATADGIRVSEMIPLPFTSDVEYMGNTADGLSYKLGLNQHKEVIAVYSASTLYFTLPEKQDGYTYEEAKAEIEKLVLNHGYPIESSPLEIYDPDSGTGKTATEGESIQDAICRMKYTDKKDNTEKYLYVAIP